jgi:hypothetical protein
MVADSGCFRNLRMKQEATDLLDPEPPAVPAAAQASAMISASQSAVMRHQLYHHGTGDNNMVNILETSAGQSGPTVSCQCITGIVQAVSMGHRVN